MELQIIGLLWVLHFKFHFGCETVKYYPNKHLLATATVVLNTRNMTSEEHCVMSCYYETPGCLAVNVITTVDVITCQMTTGLSNESDIMDDSTSILYVANYNKCAEDPGFCQNGGTCQPSWTSARCHCTDLFQGNRCQTCVDMRFTGDECDTCAFGHYGDTCSYIFTRREYQNCLFGDDLQTMTSSRDLDYENCKQWCADNNDCGGFAGTGDNCYFKGLACEDDAYPDPATHIYFKKMA